MQGGVINAAIALEIQKTPNAGDLSSSVGENYAVIRNSSRVRGSASLPRKCKDESLNIASPKNADGSQPSGRVRKKNIKSGNQLLNSHVSASNHERITTGKIIKLGSRKGIH